MRFVQHANELRYMYLAQFPRIDNPGKRHHDEREPYGRTSLLTGVLLAVGAVGPWAGSRQVRDAHTCSREAKTIR